MSALQERPDRFAFYVESLSYMPHACGALMAAEGQHHYHRQAVMNKIDPEVLQSSFGFSFLMMVWRILGKLPANFSANSSANLSCGILLALFLQRFFAPPNKSTPQIFKTFSFTPIFCLRGRPNPAPSPRTMILFPHGRMCCVRGSHLGGNSAKACRNPACCILGRGSSIAPQAPREVSSGTLSHAVLSISGWGNVRVQWMTALPMLRALFLQIFLMFCCKVLSGSARRA